MKILILGSGAREHALAYKMSQSTLARCIEVYPGNAVTATQFPSKLSGPVPEKMSDLAAQIARYAYDLVVVGQEIYLAGGISDELKAVGISVFGPDRQLAKLESSKAFAKEVMGRAQIPTASFDLASSKEEARRKADKRLQQDRGVVLKADGLAAGKGVVVCQTQKDLDDGLDFLFDNPLFSQACSSLVIEELLIGRECSFFCILGEGDDVSLGFAVDYKRRNDGDKGPNTGGMGTYCPVPWLPDNAEALVMEKVVQPLKKELLKRGLTYVGFLYVGLMWTSEGPRVIEFNVRLGDPETQVLVLSDSRDWLPILSQKLGLKLDQNEIEEIPTFKPSVAVVISAHFYPGANKVNETLPTISAQLFSEKNELSLFAGGLQQEKSGGGFTGSGRLASLVCSAKSHLEARTLIYRWLEDHKKELVGASWRTDIASRVR